MVDTQIKKASLVRLCFNNPVIVKCILQESSVDPMQNLSYRQINKTFNSEVLRYVRKKHKTIELASPDRNKKKIMSKEDGLRISTVYSIHVNFHVVPTDKIFRYFKFLTEVAKVKMTELRAKHLWIQLEHWKRHLHDEILEFIGNQPLKVFTGMEGICQSGCSRCERLAFNALEYGPIQMDFLTTLRLAPEPRHYQKLIVNEPLLDYIANTCIRKSSSQQECMSVLKTLIPPHITCDELCLDIWENYDALQPIRHQSVPLPKEIIDQMISVWNVKSLKIRFDYYLRKPRVPDDLPAKLYFTELRLDQLDDGPFEIDDGKKKKLECVEIDMSDTCHIFKEMFKQTIPRPRDSCYHLVPNVRKLFPSRQILVIGPQRANECPETAMNIYNFVNMLNLAWQDGQTLPDVDLTFRFFPSIIYFKNSFHFPPKFRFGHRWLSFELLNIHPLYLDINYIHPYKNDIVLREYDRRTLLFVDNTSNTTCTLDFYIDVRHFMHEVRHNGGTLERGFLDQLFYIPPDFLKSYDNNQ